MKKIITLLFCFLIFGEGAFATNPNKGRNHANSRVHQYIDGVYAQLKYKRGMKKMKLETFRRAYYGYLNLLEHGKVSNRRYLTVCDFSLSSNTNRLWLIDIRTKQVVINTLVAHGAKTGDVFATNFSNVPESHKSSLGFYITKQTYSGHNGYSLRMDGVDGRFNSNAYRRDVVMHGANYVSNSYARANRRIGRSWGCPSVATNMVGPIVDKIKNGSVLFIYHPTTSYIRTSYWLNNRIARLPSGADRLLSKAKKSNSKLEMGPIEETKINDAEAILEKPIAPEEEAIVTITEFQDPEEILELKKQDDIKIETIIIPADEVTHEMRAKALKKTKIVRKVNKITLFKGKNKKAVLK